ncbi:MAG: DUF58 domain-containing protein [Roseibium sp.]|uniref:DUF58 domain-containing protein n=1 Tax=Roseibium sp. TaxID=1936156 RepID=UPI0026144C55|nr:DUF58 domain-containing protein [Roseibium sp.]MCV0429152.1 DUF58 domain-containing protein [Roseibium sp.]
MSGGALRQAVALPWALLGGITLLDLVLSFRRPRATTFKSPAEIFVGETATLRISVERAPQNLLAKLEWPEGLKGDSEISFRTDQNGTAVADFPCKAVRRGLWNFDHLWLFWTSRFKLLEFVPRLDVGAELRVVPNIRLVQSGQITTTVLSTLYGVKENRAIGEGSEFHQLRDFVQGMDIKSVDWKRSARRRSLVAKELRAERNHHVIVALDNGYLMREEIGGLPKIDHAVTAALATAWAAAIGGDLVGYYSYDVRPRTFSAPAPGRNAFARLRNWTAELSYVSRETNHTLALTELNARTPKRSLIIIFTDFIDTTSAELLIENIGILAKRHLLIFVAIRDPDLEALVENASGDLDGAATLVAANQSIHERRLVLERLARKGVTIVDAKPNAITARLISAYLEIKAREQI